jgi:hypothetical protein
MKKNLRTFYIYSSLHTGSVDMSQCPYWLEVRDVDQKPLKTYQSFGETPDWQYNRARPQGHALSNQPVFHKPSIFNILFWK